MPGGAQVAVRLSESRGAGGTRAAAVIAVATLAAVLLVFLPVGAGAAGQMWVARTLPMMKNFPGHSVSCSANGCVALTSECAPGGCGGLARVTPLGSSNAGVSWVKGTFPGSVGAPTYVACASAKACVATATQGPLGPGEHSVIVVTGNGGRSWTSHVETRYNLAGAACSSPTTCVALGDTIGSPTGEADTGLVTSNGGRTWAPIAFPARKMFVEAITCSAPVLCLAAGANPTATRGVIYRSIDAGRTWAPVRLPSKVRGLRTISCTGKSCIGTSAAYQVVVSRNGGTTWSLHAIAPRPAIQDASCMSASVCMMVGFSGTSPSSPAAEVSRNGGASWASQRLPHFTGRLTGVDCSRAFCVAIGVRVSYRGKTPTAEYPEVLTYQ